MDQVLEKGIFFPRITGNIDWNIKQKSKRNKKTKQNIKIYSESTRELWRHPDLGGPWSYRDETVHCGETDTSYL